MMRSMPQPPPNSIFLCYRREDSSDVTGRIYDRLELAFQDDAVFRDVDSIPFGVDFREHVDAVLRDCHIVLVIIGPQWLTLRRKPELRRIDETLDHVRIEVERALLQKNVRVIPVLVSGAHMPDVDELPESIKDLAYRNAAVVRRDPDFRGDMARLVRHLEEHINSSLAAKVKPQLSRLLGLPNPESTTTPVPEMLAEQVSKETIVPTSAPVLNRETEATPDSSAQSPSNTGLSTALSNSPAPVAEKNEIPGSGRILPSLLGLIFILGTTYLGIRQLNKTSTVINVDAQKGAITATSQAAETPHQSPDVQTSPTEPETSTPAPRTQPIIEATSESVDAVECFTDFLAAQTWRERLKYVQLPDQTKAQMEEYYRVNSDGPISVAKIKAIEVYTADAKEGTSSATTCVLEISGGDIENQFYVMLEQSEDGWKVDWPAFIEFKDNLLKKFGDKWIDVPTRFRVNAKRIHYFDNDVPQLELKDCFRLEQFNTDFYLNTFAKKNSAVAKKLKVLGWDQYLVLIVELSWKSEGNSRWIEITDVPQFSWRITPDNIR